MEPFTPVGDHEDTSVNEVVTMISVEGKNRLMVQAFVANIRYRLDGQNPSANLGFQLKAGDLPRILYVPIGVTVKFKEEAAGAVLNFQWGR
jgi:hypothetical protein